MDDRARRPEAADSPPPAYEPPTVTPLGTIAELTRATASGEQPDFQMLNSPSPP